MSCGSVKGALEGRQEQAVHRLNLKHTCIILQSVMGCRRDGGRVVFGGRWKAARNRPSTASTCKGCLVMRRSACGYVCWFVDQVLEQAVHGLHLKHGNTLLKSVGCQGMVTGWCL